MLSPMRIDLAQRLETADPASAMSVVAEWMQHYAADQDVAASLYVPMVKADMAGQLMVRGLEAKTVELQERPADGLIDLSFDEAITSFSQRRIMTDDDLLKLIAAYKRRAGKGQELMMQALGKRVADALQRTLDEGLTLREFAAMVNEGTAGLGLEAASHGYLENVFRTNIQTAYGAGRFRQMTHPDVVAVRPYVEYRTAGDSRVRNSHAAMRGLIFKADSREWHAIAPPNGFQCRCSVVTRAADDVDPRRVTDALPDGIGADAGFGQAPTQLVEQ